MNKKTIAESNEVMQPKINGALELTCVHNIPARNEEKNAQKPIVI